MKRTHHQLTFAVLAVGAGVFALLQSIIAPALPVIQHSLNTSQSTVTWVMTAYLLSASVFTPILGRVGDILGKKRTLVAATSALAVGSVLAALAPNIGVLILARIVQGAGGAVFPLSFGIIRDEFPPARMATAIGTFSAVLAVGGGLGIVLAGPVVDLLDYHWLFWLPAITVAASALAAHLFIPESPIRSPGRVNLTSALALSAALVSLLLPISQASSWGWSSARVIGLLALAALLFVLWVVLELRSASPLIDMRIMRLPVVWRTNLTALLFGAGLLSMFTFLPQFAQTSPSTGYGLGASVTETGLLMLPMTVTMFVGGLLSGRMEHRFSARAQLVAGSGFGALSGMALTTWHDERWQIAVVAALFGLGVGLAYSAMTNLIVRSVPPHQTGAASGMNANIRTVGGSIGAAVMSSIVAGHLDGGGLPRESGFTYGFAMLTAMCLAAVVVALLVPAARRSRSAAVARAEAPDESPQPQETRV